MTVLSMRLQLPQKRYILTDCPTCVHHGVCLVPHSRIKIVRYVRLCRKCPSSNISFFQGSTIYFRCTIPGWRRSHTTLHCPGAGVPAGAYVFVGIFNPTSALLLTPKKKKPSSTHICRHDSRKRSSHTTCICITGVYGRRVGAVGTGGRQTAARCTAAAGAIAIAIATIRGTPICPIWGRGTSSWRYTGGTVNSPPV